jgi:hypothetical protein
MLLQQKTVDSIQYATSERGPPQKQKSDESQPLKASIKLGQQHTRIDLVHLHTNKTLLSNEIHSKQRSMDLNRTADSTHQSPEGRTFSTAKFKHF